MAAVMVVVVMMMVVMTAMLMTATLLMAVTVHMGLTLFVTGSLHRLLLFQSFFFRIFHRS